MLKKITKINTLILFSLFILSPVLSSPYLVLSAMKKENLSIIKLMSDRVTGEWDKVKYTSGLIEQKRTVVTYTGIGDVNAGLVTALLINHFHPHAVIFSGVAGSLQPNIKIGKVVVGTQYLSANLGPYTKKGPQFNNRLNSSPIKDKPPPLIYKGDSELLGLLHNVNKKLRHTIIFGVIATDQHFPNNMAVDRLLSKNKVKAVAMEDYGVATACWLFDTPMISIRAISDNIILNTQYTKARVILAAQHAAHVVDALFKQLP